MKILILFLSAAALLCLAFSLSSSHAAEARTWTSASDPSQTFEGTLLDYHADTGMVTVDRGGRRLTFHQKTLSARDIAYLKAEPLNAANSSEIAKVPAKELQLPGKKGACFTLREPGAKPGGTVDDNLPRIKALNVSWNYSWGTDRVDGQPSEIEFIPMIWGNSNEAKLKDRIKKMRSDIRRGKVKRLMGFNEPDGKEQANMSVERALELWPILESAGVPLASPGAVHADREWMLNFMKGVRDHPDGDQSIGL